ncbi:hypothetical protein SAMN04489740_4210 [Arthrobacter alpinus]|uniref:Uncharacterized protein n=1 Tax=Arthrobacter alpinus TaxID=656366 RepID=A0A1H5PGK7_9MICC|nr:hypothetical protein [Arthrobacter alpinus]SEF12258.1 hypothetical protein SAMN04489740_4210 [Arthrobacter alpinus]
METHVSDAVRDDPVLAADERFVYERRSVLIYWIVAALGAAMVLFGAFGFRIIGAWAASGGDETGRVAVPVVVMIVGAWLLFAGLNTVRAERARWIVRATGERLVCRRCPQPGSEVDADALWNRFAKVRHRGTPPYVQGGLRGPIKLRGYLDDKAQKVYFTIIRTDQDGTRAWPLLELEGAEAVRFVPLDRSGADPAGISF